VRPLPIKLADDIWAITECLQNGEYIPRVLLMANESQYTNRQHISTLYYIVSQNVLECSIPRGLHVVGLRSMLL
jgi:hypothetical protein